VVRLTDATGATVSLAATPRRIVSLVPSTTETVFELGAGDRVVGVTRYCVRPDGARRQARVVGGTKSPRLETIRELDPDLILANQEENREEDVQALRQVAPVYVAFPRDVPAAIAEILKLGILTGREAVARRMCLELAESLQRLREARDGRPVFPYLYFIWRQPYMAAGPGTFIDALLGEAGGRNVLDGAPGRYPELTAEQIETAGADVLFFSSEPYPFAPRHLEEIPAARGKRILVDGQLLSWHGARMREGIPYAERVAREVAG
jgi:ABC-type Fe3+-hydroxamate transport system substrate-binding protein